MASPTTTSTSNNFITTTANNLTTGNTGTYQGMQQGMYDYVTYPPQVIPYYPNRNPSPLYPYVPQPYVPGLGFQGYLKEQEKMAQSFIKAQQIDFGKHLQIQGDASISGKLTASEIECESIKQNNPKPTLKELMDLAWKMYELTAQSVLRTEPPNSLNLPDMPKLYIKYLKTLREEFGV